MNFLRLQPNYRRLAGGIICLLALTAFSTSIIAQTISTDGSILDETVQELPGGDPVTEFIRPLTDAFGANMNTGWINNSPGATIMGLDVQIGLVFMGALIDPDEGVFQLVDAIFPFKNTQAATLAGGISGFDQLPAQQQQAIIDAIAGNESFRADVSGPNVFGDEDASLIVVSQEQTISVDGQTYTVPSQTFELDNVNGIVQDPGIFPTVAPQLNVGTYYGTAVALRWLPSVTLSDDIGKINYFGFGIQHNPFVWLNNPPPFKVSLSYFTQNLSLGEALDTKTQAFGITASKRFGKIISVTPYAGFLFEKSRMDINYVYEIAPGVDLPIDVEVDGANKYRGVLGVNANLLGVNLYADYNISEVHTINLSLMYGF